MLFPAPGTSETMTGGRRWITWIRIGTRYINLANVIEAHVREMPLGTPRGAQVFFVGGSAVELDEDDTRSLLTRLADLVAA